MPTLAAEWHLGEVFLVFLEFAMFVIWIWLLIMIFGDLFRKVIPLPKNGRRPLAGKPKSSPDKVVDAQDLAVGE